MNRFNQRFGITSTIEDEKQKFINRVEDAIFKPIQSDYHSIYGEFFKVLCVVEGLSYQTVQGKWNSFNRSNVPPIHFLTDNDFIKTLRILTYILSYVNFAAVTKENVTMMVEKFIENSEVDLGIEFTDGDFYPKGEELLDKELIDSALDSLKKYPEQNKRIKNALKHYSAKELESTLSECYLAMEGLCRVIFSNNKTLDNNKSQLLTYLKLSQEWKSILSNYIVFIHEYGRHASKNQKNIRETEVEACLYQTCLLIRLIAKDLP
jgi:hypothetical protein